MRRNSTLVCDRARYSVLTPDTLHREVHLWLLDLELAYSLCDMHDRMLSGDELEKVSRFASSELSYRYRATRVLLRYLLSKYLRTSPKEIQFTYGANGKPHLRPDHSLEFNVSHSGNRAAVAITANSPVGVDLEEIRSIPEASQISAQCFSPEEVRQLAGMATLQQISAFMWCWSRKEALLKAMGCGLSEPMNVYHVGARLPLEPWEISVTECDRAGSTWQVQDIPYSPACSMAVAYRGAPKELLVRHPTLSHILTL
ncbi:MAG: phosphopantetheine-protein transferase [Acidobacteriaceae bacterium]|nr:phosphopantetheine-protein transferase [Acidobacteriaceae bacterium]